MIVDLEMLDYISTSLVIISVIITIFPIILKFREGLSKTIFYQKIESKARIYSLWVSKTKFLIFAVIVLIIGLIIVSISIYQIIYPSHTIQSETISPREFIAEEKGGVFGISKSGNLFIKIDKDQNFMWKRGWNENKILKKIKINYTTSGTQILIVMGSKITPYLLNSTSEISTLEIENLSIPYEKNKAYYMSVINTGENSFNLFEIKIEEEVPKTKESSIISIMLSYILFVVSFNLYKQHKKILYDEKVPPLDLLKKEALYADRLQNIEIELEVHQNMLKKLDVLNLKSDISPNFYHDKKNHFVENIHTLINEKNTITSEIEDTLRKFKIE